MHAENPEIACSVGIYFCIQNVKRWAILRIAQPNVHITSKRAFTSTSSPLFSQLPSLSSFSLFSDSLLSPPPSAFLFPSVDALLNLSSLCHAGLIPLQNRDSVQEGQGEGAGSDRYRRQDYCPQAQTSVRTPLSISRIPSPLIRFALLQCRYRSRASGAATTALFLDTQTRCGASVIAAPTTCTPYPWP